MPATVSSSPSPPNTVAFFVALALLGFVMLSFPRAAPVIGVVVILGALLINRGLNVAAPITAFNKTFLGG